MEWTFSISALLIGMLIVGAGAAVVAFHQKIAEHLANGVSSYDKVKLAGVITIIVGFIVMINLHAVILGWLVDIIFRR